MILICRSWYHADEEAGKMRDAMTDEECGLDYEDCECNDDHYFDDEDEDEL